MFKPEHSGLDCKEGSGPLENTKSVPTYYGLPIAFYLEVGSCGVSSIHRNVNINKTKWNQ